MLRGRVFCPLTRRRFSLPRRRINSDAHQSPFWVKATGLLPTGEGTRPLARGSPRKSSVPHPGAKWSAEAGVHRLLARRPAGAVQPLSGSLAGTSRSQTVLRGVWVGMRWRPIRSGGSRPTPFAGSPRHSQTDSGEGPTHCEVGAVAQDVVTGSGQFVGHRLDRHHTIGLGPLALVAHRLG